jgi:DNA-binding response OmpR family regulator
LAIPSFIRKQVLVVEDDPALQKLVCHYLQQMGMDVRVASDGKSAINILREKIPDLVCLDLMLPEVSGYDVCEFIRRTVPLSKVPVLVMSARTLPEDRANAEDVGANAYLSKPFSRKQFSQHVAELLEAPRAPGPGQA